MTSLLHHVSSTCVVLLNYLNVSFLGSVTS